MKTSSRLLSLTIAATLSLMPLVAKAVPSYARQLNMACTACHSEFPILTELGRQFKLGGYTMSAGVTDLPPLSVMLQPSFTATAKGQPGGAAPHFADNNNFALNQLSLFYAGRLLGPYADKIFEPDTAAFLNKFGVFLQTTYDGVGRSWAWDNAELRFADNGTIFDKPVTYGFYANNNPGLQDPWNSTPAWNAPFSSSSLAPTPGAGQLIDGGLSQQVLGLGGYAMISNTLYFDVALYRTAGPHFQKSLGVDPTGETQVPGVAPYWRAAYTKAVGNSNYELGIFGMAADTYPGRVRTAGKDHITDLGVDSEYQTSFGQNDVTALLSGIYENQNLHASQALGGATNSSNDLWTMKATVDYLYDKTYGGAISYFLANGNHDPLLYSGSTKGSPMSDGVVFQLNYMPFNKSGGPSFWPRSNVKFSIQYVMFDRFDGGRRNYDGSGRNAWDNNTLYIEAWFVF